MSDKKTKVSVSGVVPAAEGENWFVIDKSGIFTIDSNIIATIYVVGGGCDGTAGAWNGNEIESVNNPISNTGTGTSYAGNGGDGGYVYTTLNVKIKKDQELTSVIAERNDRTGTSLDTGNAVYRCNQSGSISRLGGTGGNLPLAETDAKFADQSLAVLSTRGHDGVDTPYGYVGSSGGGGAVCNGTSNAANGITGGEGAGDGTNHRTAGTSATNYGCGGGGGAICGSVAKGQNGGLGKGGCIIVVYSIEEKSLVVIKHYKKTCTTRKSCNTSSCCSTSGCCSANKITSLPTTNPSNTTGKPEFDVKPPTVFPGNSFGGQT